jgi:3-methyladenine DNA glycosylase/8-oxoguanine DNA glycosylase
LRRLGLHERRGAALVRLCRSLELERLHTLPTDGVVRRLERERGLGPWSAGVVCLEGLGRFEHGLVGDLGLIKLCARCAGGRSRDGRRRSCSSRTASGPASRASTSSPASAAA